MQETKTIHVNRWGNGLGIRLPKEFIDKVGITETSRVEVRSTDDVLMVSCVKEPRRHIPLAERLKNWDGNPYELTDEDRQWIDMKPVGEEIC
ncbi:MAG: AbrB/MazE/SpoVT family DNA-binding domain-containing protein [Spirochaetaceae bacterium]|jgi:antitoxin component of MazEF toxin-antitoxin module|nr:AbrB/MazE/SpoVT family DNA-binding domain-containing protein [Spirochaetaceae bacterium]